MAYQLLMVIQCQNAKSWSYIYIKYMINILNESELIFFHTVKWFHLFLSNTNIQLNDQTILLQTIQFSICIQFLVYTVSHCLNSFLLTQLNIKNSSISNHLVQHVKVKWFQVLLCITNNSTKHQLLVYLQLNDQTLLFQTIHFSISTDFFVYTKLNIKTVLFQTTQFSISTQFKC